MKVNDKVRMMRELRSWSQEEMAHRLGMSTNGYAKLERGETRLNIPKLEQIAEVFDIDLSDLLAVNERSVICLISENSQHSSNFYGASQELSAEVERLRLMIAHKDELLAQQAREIETLRTLAALLQPQQQK
ncbi:MAG: helix-turn-helix transcriptional regulator [Cardiobacteriaceae bacterium]|nr:helix-turn-helix transcriptional regulator [Cardiobacteriaceae bacterium]